MKKEVNYKEAYLKLKQRCHNLGYTVKEVVDSKTKDYVGMNDLAAKDIGYPRMSKKCLYVDNWLGYEARYHTLKHEMIERKLMSQGKRYWSAHTIALRREKYGK